MTSAAGSIRLYELVLDNGCSASPYVWRIRYALAHKGIACEPMPVGFTEIPKIFGGRYKTVPIIEHGTTVMSESWDIAEYLDRAFPGAPALFSGPAELAMVRLTDAWFSAEIMRKMFGVYVLDIHNAARPEDRPYFRRTRELRLKGATLEEFAADRAARLPALRDALTPLRAYLERFPYVGGGAPNYADYIVLGAFRWVASVSTLPMLSHDDTLRAWIDRVFDLYGGLRRDARMKALFE
ncbi:MAG: glutathione S-transferase N-terminal domain-containing protein [Gammaproteobacteria bacterium]